MPKLKRRRLSQEASIIRLRTSAANPSHTRGASSTKVGPISRKSAQLVLCSSTKFTTIRHCSAFPKT